MIDVTPALAVTVADDNGSHTSNPEDDTLPDPPTSPLAEQSESQNVSETPTVIEADTNVAGNSGTTTVTKAYPKHKCKTPNWYHANV